MQFLLLGIGITKFDPNLLDFLSLIIVKPDIVVSAFLAHRSYRNQQDIIICHLKIYIKTLLKFADGASQLNLIFILGT